MILAYYQILLLISVVLTLVYLMSWHKHFDVHVTLIFTFVPIAILGNLLTARAKTIEEATLANKITYLGATFLMLIITLTILNLCDIKVPRAVRMVFVSLSMIVYLSSLTVGYGNIKIFYKSYGFVVEDGVGRLIDKDYGVMHTVFAAMILGYFAISFAAMVYSYFKKKNVPKKIILLMFIPEMIAVFAFYGGRSLITDKIELISIAYVFAQIMYLIIINQVCLYDITDSGIDSLVQTGDKGFLSFDFKRHYLGCNVTALGVFPELAGG